MPRLTWSKTASWRWLARYPTGELCVLMIERFGDVYVLVDASEGLELLDYGPYLTLASAKRAVAQLV